MALPLQQQAVMRSILVGGLFSLALTSGCTSLSDSEARSGIEGDSDHEGCKIEGSQIGQTGTVLDLGSSTVTITSWVAKAGEPNEYVGFSFTLAGASSIVYTVKAGTEKYIDDATTYLLSDPAGNAISHVDFCDCDEEPPGGGSGSGSGSGSGDGTIL